MKKNKEDIWIEDEKIFTPVKDIVYFEDDELNVEIEDFTVVETSIYK
ncbi:hypothetical protein [Bacillus altitudinis]|nr:hypothetical protein [Bacillus altitudinis]